MLYTVEAVDWKEGKRHSDIHLVSTEQGTASNRPMTFTPNEDESSPTWARDGSFFIFTSNRDADEKKQQKKKQQLYSMRPDGGEARRLTDAKEGVSDFAFSRDGRWLAAAGNKR